MSTYIRGGGVAYTDAIIVSQAVINEVESNIVVLSDPTSSNYTKLSPTLDSNGTDLLQIKSVNIETGEDTQVQRLEVNSIISGINPTASAPGAATFGINNIATNTGSFVEGVGTLASGFAAHAAGFNTTASGYAAFSVGVETDADGTASFAAGSGSWARGTATVAMGIGTVASSSGQLVVGHYNETKTDINNIFVVGDGTGPLSVNRRNIIEVYGGQGALFRGVKIDTATTPTITTTINGFNVYGQTYLRGNTDILTNKITSTGDTTLGTSGSIIFEAYNSLPALEGRTVMDWKGINFDDAFGTTSPGSTYLWRNNIVNHLYYGSSQLIQDGGNNTSTVANPLIIGTTNASNLELETNNTTRIFISSSGRVGIGTSSPTNTLQVVGGITATSITASIISASIGITGSLNVLSGNIKIDNSYKILGDGNHLTTYNYDSNFPSSTSASFGLVNIGGVGSYITAREDNLFGSSTILQFFTQGSERARITAGGRLGINTTTPGARLVVKGDSALSSGVTFQALNSSDTTLLYVRDDGNVGIGTTSPTARLHISGANNGALLIASSSTAPSALFVSGSGNVGIGTGTPTNTLQVVGGITATSITASIISASSGITGSLFGTSSWAVSASQALTASFLNGAFLQNGNSFGTTAILGTNDNQNLQFETSGSVRMTISSSGNIGIGTTPTSPFRLDVSGSARFGSGSVGFASGLGQIHAVDRTGAYITATQTTSSIVAFMGADNNGGIVGTYSNNDFSIRNNNTNKILLQGINVGIQTAPAEWIHLSSEPVGSKYIQIDAAQASNNPPFYAPGGGNSVARVWGNIGDDYVLGTPDYWMEIKLDGTVVLIPCYTPTP